MRREPDFVVRNHGEVYLNRWYIIPKNRLFNIYLHEFKQSDEARAEHDHPWHSLGVILKGHYNEFIKGKKVYRSRFRPVWRKATHIHRIELIDNEPVLTLFITGPKIREWGFDCPKGWKHWRDFVSQDPQGNDIGPGCD